MTKIHYLFRNVLLYVYEKTANEIRLKDYKNIERAFFDQRKEKAVFVKIRMW